MAKQLAFQVIFAWLVALTALVLRPEVVEDVRSFLVHRSRPLSGSGSIENVEEELYYGVTSSDVKVLSYDPFIAHVSNLVSPEEREYLIRLSWVVCLLRRTAEMLTRL